jgi:hypothetical protein
MPRTGKKGALRRSSKARPTEESASCSEKRNLLDRYRVAVELHTHAVNQFKSAVGPDATGDLYRLSLYAFEMCEQALVEIEEHVINHGC